MNHLRPLAVLASLLSLTLVLTACGGGGNQPASTSWRNIDLDLPEGWYLVEDEDTRLTIANRDLRAVDDDGNPVPPEGDVVGMFFTYEPGAIPNDWRAWVERQGGRMESDQAMVLGEETPATRLIFSREEADGTSTREMVVVIPSRHIVVLAQPVPRPGDTDAPEVFLEHIQTFLDVLESARLGAPVLD